MELPKEILEQRAEQHVLNAETRRWLYALSCSRMYRRVLMRNDKLRLGVEERATKMAGLMSSRELKGRAGLHAALGDRVSTCVFVRAYLKSERGYAS